MEERKDKRNWMKTSISAALTQDLLMQDILWYTVYLEIIVQLLMEKTELKQYLVENYSKISRNNNSKNKPLKTNKIIYNSNQTEQAA